MLGRWWVQSISGCFVLALLEACRISTGNAAPSPASSPRLPTSPAAHLMIAHSRHVRHVLHCRAKLVKKHIPLAAVAARVCRRLQCRALHRVEMNKQKVAKHAQWPERGRQQERHCTPSPLPQDMPADAHVRVTKLHKVAAHKHCVAAHKVAQGVQQQGSHEMSPLCTSSCAPAAASCARRAVVCREGSISLASMEPSASACPTSATARRVTELPGPTAGGEVKDSSPLHPSSCGPGGRGAGDGLER